MSTTVDNYAVNMQFNSADFENKVSSTMSVLEKFKSSLSNLGHDSASVAMNTLGSGVDSMKRLFGDAKESVDDFGTATKNITGEFSAMDIAFATTIANMTKKVEEFASTLVKSLTIDPVKLGFEEYETQISATQVIKSNTGKSVSEINEVLDEMNVYADKTIYNFTQMTNNLGKFVAQGVELDKAKDAIIGMANAAAMFGASPEDLTRATYQMSQALGGVIRMQDWNSLKNANMATEKLKQTIIDTAVEMGVLESSTPDWGAMVKGATTFEKSLEAGWLTGDIFVEAMRKFNDTTTALGIEAQEAATHAKTFTQLRDATMEAVQSGWTMVFRTIIGDLDQAENFWSKVNDALNGEHGVITAYSNAIGGAFEEWSVQGGREKAIEALSDAFHGLLDVLIPVKDAISDFMPSLDGDKLLEFTDKVAESASKFHDFGMKFRSYFGEFAEKYEKEVKKWSETVTSTEEKSASSEDVEAALRKSVMNNAQYRNIVSSYLGMLKGSSFRDDDGNLVESKIRSYLSKEGLQVFDRFLDSNGGTYKNSKSVIDLIVGQVMGTSDYTNKYYTNSVKSQSHLNVDQWDEDTYHAWRAILAQNGIDVDEQLDSIRESLKTYEQISKEVMHVEEETKALIVPASDLHERVSGTALAAKNLYTIVNGFPTIINGIKSAIGGIYEKIIQPIASNIFGNALQTALQIFGRITTDLATITNLIEHFGIVDKVLDSLYNFFNRNFDIAGWFQTLYNTFINFRSTIVGLTKDVASFFGYFDDSKLITRIRAVGTVLFQSIRDLLGNNVMTGGLIGTITGVLTGAFTGFFKGGAGGKFGGIAGMIKGAFSGIFSGAFNGAKFGGILELLNKISKMNFSSSGIIGFIQGIGDGIGGLIEKIKNFNIEEFMGKAKGALDKFFEVITIIGTKDNGQFSITTFISNFFKLGTSAIEAFINGLLGKKNEAQEKAKSLFDYIVEFAKMAFDSFKNSGFGQYIIGVFNGIKTVATGLYLIVTSLFSLGLTLLENVIIPLLANLNAMISHTLPDGDTIGKKISDTIGWIAGTALPTLVGWITKAADKIGSFVDWVIKAHDGIKEFFDEYKKNNPDSLLTKFLNLLSGLKGKASDAFGVIKKDGVEGIKSLWNAFKISEVGKTLLALVEIVKSFGSAIKQGFTGASESAEGLTSAFGFKNLDTASISGFLSSVARAIQEFPTSESFEKMKSALVVFGEGARDLWDALGALMDGAIIPFFTFLKDNLPNAIKTVYDLLLDGWRNIADFIADKANGDFSLESLVKNIIGDPLGAVNTAFSSIASGLGKIGSLLFSGLSGAIGGHTTYADDLTNESLYTMKVDDFSKMEKYVEEYKRVAKEAGIAQEEIDEVVSKYSAGYLTYDIDDVASRVWDAGRLLKLIDDIQSGGEDIAEATGQSSTKIASSVTNATSTDIQALINFADTLKEKFTEVAEIASIGFEKFKEVFGQLADNEAWRNLALGAFGIFALKQVTNRATKGWTKAFTTVSKQVGEDGKSIITTLSNGLKDSSKSLKEGMTGIFGPFEEIGKALGKTFDLITSAFNNINKVTESMAKANRAEAFKDYSTGILFLAAAFSAVALVVDKIGLDKWKVLLTAAGIIAGLLVAGCVLMTLIEKFSNATNNAVQPLADAQATIPSVLHSFLNDLGDSLNDFLKKAGTKELLIGIAVAVAALTASLVALSFIPGEDLAKAGFALAGIAVGLRALMKAAGNGNNLSSGLGVMLIATAIATLVGTMKTIAALDPGAISGSIASIGFLLAELWLFLKGTKGSGTNTSQSAKDLLSAGVAMAAIGIGIKSLASAVKNLGNLEWDVIFKGLLSVGALLLEMGVFVNHTKNTQMFTKTAAAMVVMSTALNIMSVAVRNFGSIDWDVLGKGLISVAGLMFTISGALKLMDGVTIPIGSSIAMIALAGAINMLDDAVKNLGKVDFWSLIKGVGSVMLLMSSVSEAVNTMQGDSVKFKSMLASAVLIVEMYGTLSLIKQYGEIDFWPLLKGVLSFIAIIWSISGATKLLGDYKGGIIKPFIMMAGLLTSVTAVLYFLSNSELDSERFLQFAEGISMCIISIGAIAGILGALQMNLATGVAAGSAIMGFIGTIAGLAVVITGAFAIVGTIINAIVNGVADLVGINLDEDFDLFEWLGSYIERFVGFIGTLAGTITGSAIASFNEAMGDNSPLVALGEHLESFGSSIVAFKDSLVTLKDLGSEEIGAGISSFCEAIGAITGSELKDAVSDLIHSWLVDGDDDGTNALSDFGTDLAGFGEGASKFSEFIMKVNNGIKGKAQKIADVLDLLTGVVPKSGSIFEHITGGQDFEEFGGKFATFGSKISEFAANVGDVKNASSIAAVTPVMSSVAELMGMVYAFDVAQFESLSGVLPGLGENLGTFASKINTLDDTKAAASVNLVEQVIALQTALNGYDAEALNNVSAFLTQFDGFSGSFTTFMTNLSGAVSNVQEISIIDKKGEVKKKFADTSEILALAMSPIEAIQDLITKFKEIEKDRLTITEWFTGDTTLSHLGTELSTFGTNYSDFMKTVAGLNNILSGSEYNTTLDGVFEQISKIVESLNVFNDLPAQTGFFARYFGAEDASLAGFGTNLAKFGESLRKFANGLMTSDENAKSLNELLSEQGSAENFKLLVDQAAGVIKAFNDVVIPDQGSFLSKLITKDTSLETFGAGLGHLGEGLTSFCNAASGIADLGIIDSALDGIGKILTFFNENGIDEGKVGKFNTSLDFIDQFNTRLQNMLGVNSTSVEENGPLKPIYDIFTEAGEKAIEKFTGGLDNDNKYTLYNACKTVVDLANSDIMEYVDETLGGVGEYYVQGFAKGIHDYLEDTEAASTELGAAALAALEEILEIESPSKRTFLDGIYLDRGLGNGIKDELSYATDESEKLARAVMEPVEKLADEGKEAGKSIGQEVVDGAVEAIDAATEGIKDSGLLDSIEKVKDAAGEKIGEVTGSIANIAEDIGSAVSEAISPLTDKISTAFSSFTSIFSSDGSFFTDLMSGLSSAWADPEATLEELYNNMVNPIGGLTDNVFGGESIFSGITDSTDSLLSQFENLGEQLGSELGLNSGESLSDGIAEGLEGSTAKIYDSIDNLAWRVISGEFGNGQERVDQLEALGVSYGVIQNRVNELLGCNYRYATSNEDLTKTLTALGDAVEETAATEEEAKSALTQEEVTNILNSIAAYEDKYKQLAETVYGKSYDELIEEGIIQDAKVFRDAVTDSFLSGDSYDTITKKLSQTLIDALNITDESSDEAKKAMNALAKDATNTAIELNEKVTAIMKKKAADSGLDDDIVDQIEESGEKITSSLYQYAEMFAGAEGLVTDTVAESLNSMYDKGNYEGIFTYLEDSAKRVKQLLADGNVEEAFEEIQNSWNILNQLAYNKSLELDSEIVRSGKEALETLSTLTNSYAELKILGDELIGDDDGSYMQSKNDEFIRKLKSTIFTLVGEIDNAYKDTAFNQNIQEALNQLDAGNIDGTMKILASIYDGVEKTVEIESNKVRHASEYIDKATELMMTGDFDKAGMEVSNAATALLQDIDRARGELKDTVIVYNDNVDNGFEELSHLRSQINASIEEGDLSAALATAKRYNDALNAELEKNEIDTRSSAEIFAEHYKEEFKIKATELASYVSESSKDNLDTAMKSLGEFVNEFTENFGDEYKEAADYLKSAFEEVEKNNDWGTASEYLTKASDYMAEVSTNAASEYKSASDELAAAYEDNAAGNTEAVEQRLNAALADMDEKTVLLEEFKATHADQAKTVEENAVASSEAVAESADSIVSDVKEASQDTTDAVRNATSELKTEVKDTIDDVLDDLDSSVSKFETAGENLASGLARGYVNKVRSEAIAEMNAANQEVIDATRAKFDENSPSRVFEQIGSYCGEGLYIGVDSWHEKIQNAMLGTADGMITGAQHALRVAQLATSSDLEINPSIAPVVDMTNIEDSEVAAKVFGKRPMIEFGDLNIHGIDKVRNLADAMAEFTNDNSDVVDAIYAMRGDITSLGTSFENMQIVMDSGRLVGQISGDVNRSLGRASRLRGRGVY